MSFADSVQIWPLYAVLLTIALRACRALSAVCRVHITLDYCDIDIMAYNLSNLFCDSFFLNSSTPSSHVADSACVYHLLQSGAGLKPNYLPCPFFADTHSS